jgi:hypothetical protein
MVVQAPKMVFRSSAEADYRAVAEASWLRQLLTELQTPLRQWSSATTSAQSTWPPTRGESRGVYRGQPTPINFINPLAKYC